MADYPDIKSSCQSKLSKTNTADKPENFPWIKDTEPDQAYSETRGLLRHPVSAVRRLKLESKPRSGSCSGSLNQRRYAENLDTLGLTGSGCMSPKDIIFRVPPLPVQPPRLLFPQPSIQKAYSTPDIARAEDYRLSDPDEAIPVDNLHVINKISSVTPTNEDSGNESECEDNYVIWSDDDVSMTSSTSTSSPGCDVSKILEESQTVDKAHYVARELTNTEQSYVRKLEILQKARSKTEEILGTDIARRMFPNVNSIYRLHQDNFLPHLKQRLSKWSSCPYIGDIMKTFSPYLKIYTDYVKTFHEALDLLETWYSKNPSFSQMLRSLTLTEKCYNNDEETFDLRLQIKAHMLEPIQRLPRYQLLLQQYCKEIDVDSNEYQDIQVALTSITQAAIHFEDMMKHDTQMGELSNIQRQIDCPFNLISSNRYLIKQGKIGKVHATTGKVADRYMFLFNDLLLLCSENQWMSFSVYKYKVRHLAEIDAIQVADGNNLDVPFTFYIKTKKKAIELCGRNGEEMKDWVQNIWQVIGDRMRSKLSKANQTNIRRTMLLCSEGSLGKEAPSWIHNSQVSMCMLCAANFKGLRRKHHCRSCGMVVCNKCSSHTAPLEYEDFKDLRICDECYLLLEDNNHIIKQHSTYQKSINDSVYKGYMEMSSDLGKTWHRRWLEVHSDHSLCCYKAPQDIRPLIVLHLSCCTIEVCVTINYSAKIIRVQSEEKVYLLKPDDKKELPRWVDALRTLSVRT